MLVLGWEGNTPRFSSSSPAKLHMCTFNIPSEICEKLDSTSIRFWWKPKASKGRFIAWKAWDKLCLHKCQGGLGFKKAKEFNSALLAKLGWMVASKRKSICMDILRAKYKVNHDWLHNDPASQHP